MTDRTPPTLTLPPAAVSLRPIEGGRSVEIVQNSTGDVLAQITPPVGREGIYYTIRTEELHPAPEGRPPWKVTFTLGLSARPGEGISGAGRPVSEEV
jgi:hypothetical protein